MPTILHAQESDDVLVMRRAIEAPTGKTSIQPSPDFQRVPLTLRDTGENTYAIKGNIGLEIETIGCLLTSGAISTDDSLCVEGQGPSAGDVINFPAEMDPDLRTYYVARSTYTEYLPQFSAQQIESLCTGTVTISGTTYQGSCDPEAVVNTYAWVPNGLEDPNRDKSRFPEDLNSSENADSVNLYVNNIRCKLTSTGEAVDNSYCSSLGKSPAFELVQVPAVFNSEFRAIYTTPEQVVSVSPDMSDTAAASVCGKAVRVGAVNWTIDCTEPKDAADYLRVASALLDPYANYSASAIEARYVNDSPDRGLLTFSVNGLRCFEFTSGTAQQAEYQDCTYLTEGPSQYDLVTFPATYVPELKAVYLEQEDIIAALPYDGKLDSYTPAQVCSPDFNGFLIKVGPSAAPENWTVFCGDPEDPANYERQVNQALDPVVFYPSGQYDVQRSNSDFNADSYAFTVKSTTCINKATGESGGSKCDHLTEGPSVYDVIRIPATLVSQLREIYVQGDDLSAALGSNGKASYYDSSSFYKTADEICSDGLARLKVGPSADQQEWTMICGDPANPADFTSNAIILNDPYDNYHYSDRTNREVNSDPNAVEYHFTVFKRDCVNQATGEEFAPTKCDYLDNALKDYQVVSAPATFVPDLREIYFDEATLRATFPKLTNIDSGKGTGSTIAQFCEGIERQFWVNGDNWIAYCGEADDPANYADIAYNLVDPTGSYPNSAYRSLNDDLSSGEFKFGVNTTRCIRVSDGSYAGNMKCRYLTENKAQKYDIITIPVTYDIDSREIRVTRADLEIAMPYGASASYYGGNYKNVDQICNGELRNLKAGGDTTGWKMVCVN